MSNQFRTKLLKHLIARHQYRDKASGFTMIEILVVVIIIGVLASIAGPSWVAFINRQKISSSTNAIYTALKGAQSQAKKDSRPKVVTLDTTTAAQKITDEQGKVISLESGVKILSITYNGVAQTGTCANINSIMFDEKGTPFKVAAPTALPCTLNTSGARSTASLPVKIRLKHDLIGQEQCITIRTLLGTVDTNCN